MTKRQHAFIAGAYLMGRPLKVAKPVDLTVDKDAGLCAYASALAAAEAPKTSKIVWRMAR